MMAEPVPGGLRGYRYVPRRVAFQGVRPSGRWRVKTTVITVRGTAAHFADEIEAAQAFAAGILDAAPDRDADVAFFTIHLGLAGVWLLVDRWEGDLLRHRHFLASFDDPARFRDVAPEHFGPCVWELAVQAHERTAWITHVLASPTGPDLDAYLADGMDATV